DFLEDARDALDVLRRDGVVGACGRDDREIDVQALRERAHGRRRTNAGGHRRAVARRDSVAHGRGVGVQAADDRAGFRTLVGAVGELDERAADGQQIAGLRQQALDLAGARAWYLDERLLGLDGEERLVDGDVVVLADVPRRHFRLLQTFA